MNLHSLFLSIWACSGDESTTAFGGDCCLEVIEFVRAVLDASSTLNNGWPDGADELPRLSPVNIEKLVKYWLAGANEASIKF